MLLALITAAALGAMPVPLFTPRAMDVSGAPVLATLPGAAWMWADLGVDATGKLTGCEVIASSGSKLLDRVGCARAVKAARFSPARDETGALVAARVRQAFAVNQSLPDNRAIDYALAVDRAMPPGAVPVADLRVVTDGGGKIVTCAVATSSGMRVLDDIACKQVIGVVRTLVRQGTSPTMSMVSVGFTGSK